MSEVSLYPHSAVLSVEYIARAKISTGQIRDCTQARVRTSMGEVSLRVPGFKASPDAYPELIGYAEDVAWGMFCNA